MQINYEDERFQDVKAEEKEALAEVQQTYDGMIDKAGTFYEGQINDIDKWTQKQQTLQQEQTDFAVEQLQQQKDQAQKDYIKEQSGAFTDWKKQSSQHGANAEQMAGIGMTGTGYSESSQVAMYNAYQSRVAAARESFSQAVLTYDNAMKEARMQGSAAMAQIAFEGFQQQMELTLQGFQYENQLLQQQLTQKQQVQNTFYGRWQDILAQLNNEAALAEQQRQFNENMAMQQKEYEEGIRQFNEELAEQQRQFNEQMVLKQNSTSGGGSGSGGDTQTLEEAESVEAVEPVAAVADALAKNQTTSNPKLGVLAYLNGEGNAKGLSDKLPSYRAPSSVEGHGKLVDTSDTVDVEIKQNGKQVTVEMPVRKAEDGTLWGWDPQQKEFFQVGTNKSWRRKER